MPMGSNKYIVYNVNHHGFLFENICLRYLLNRKDNVILIIPENKGDYYSNKMVDEGIFLKSITFPLGICAGHEGEALKRMLNDYFDDLLSKNGINLDEITQIYTMADVINPFGIYAALRGKKITIIEEGINRFSDMNKYEEFYNSKIISKSYRDIQKELGILCGENDEYDLILRDGTDETNYFGYTHRYGPVDYKICYDRLTKSEKDSILRAYDVKVEKYHYVDTILFLNSDGYTSSALDIKMTVSDVYATLADYCSEEGDRFLIKPHPYNYDINKDDFPYDDFIKNYPIEVIGLIDNVKIRRAISVHTTATKKIANFINEDISLGATFFRMFSYIHRTFVSLSTADHINSISKYKVFQNITTEKDYFNNLFKLSMPNSNYKKIEYIDKNLSQAPSILIISDMKKISSHIMIRDDDIIISFNPIDRFSSSYKMIISLIDAKGVSTLTEYLYIDIGTNVPDILHDFKIVKKLPRRRLKLEATLDINVG